ncbi:5-bromo-4-chloroindolyl phosphate hydrolysis family protein [Antarctobacter heliothermus]|uniref:5-bromo-4-chloroindolyl phosphate hydrolysis protein n=1 Tax=Antarctobacter heliothermus TaxID=74033 RepID=A0A239BZ09_9RHOB|nr:5-bromo-4-chloroindolyl phosphate hydrolysis family protein [Antarctobacter heliothermus]SNS13110.1 5-bromo-4-chloroindolyl phosphate hydrolysis protein [Antarctobacter heliothermus]
MAQRFGGKHSPDGASGGLDDRPRDERPAYHGARVAPAGARSNVLFIPGVILALLSINDGAVGMAVGLAGAAVLVLGAWLLRDGLLAEAAFHDRKVARRPAIPRKIFAAALCGIGAGLAAWRSEPGLIAPLIFGGAAGALHLGAFGIDPMKDKGMEGIDTFTQDRVARVVNEAESYLSAMTDAVRRAGDRQVEARVERFVTKAREMIRTVEEDPRDLSGAKKFLSVYLMGARDATVKFADVFARSNDRAARSDYMMLLTDLEESFDKKTDKLLADNNEDLNVEIEVLRDRLQREGVHLDRR